MRVLSCLALLGLLSVSAGADEKKPDIAGPAANVRAATPNKAGVLGSMLIEAPKGEKWAYDKAVVRVNEKTKIQKQNGKLVEDAKFEDIKNGVKISVWFTGPVAESYPVQATAGKILIFPAADGKK